MRTRTAAARLGALVLALAAAALPLAACGSPAPRNGVPTVEGGFVIPTPVPPTGAAMLRPAACLERGGDRIAVMRCMAPYLEEMLAAIYGPVLTERGMAFERPTIVMPDESATTACGEMARPAYCPADSTVVLPLEALARTGDEGAAFLLSRRSTWADDGIMAPYLDVPVASLRRSGPMSLVVAMAHEYSHHVEALMGSVDDVASKAAANPSMSTAYAAALELGADCLAGWGLKVGTFERPSKTESFGVRALLAAIGDDYGAVAAGTPAGGITGFAHGSMAERYDAFSLGYSLGSEPTDPYLACRENLVSALDARTALPQAG